MQHEEQRNQRQNGSRQSQAGAGREDRSRSSSQRGGREGRGDDGESYGSSGSSRQRQGSSESGQRSSGGFAGRGPKGYSRSDDSIREDLCQQLSDDSDIDASEIEVKVNDGEVTLSGTVEERRTKRMIEDVCDEISGVKDVRNEIKVQSRSQSDSSQSETSSTRSSGSKSKDSSGSQTAH